MRKLKPYVGLTALLLLIQAVVTVQLLPPKFAGWVPVTVQPGQTLWTLGTSHCPDADPRDVIQAIEQRNHIGGSVKPGQVVLVPTKRLSSWSRLTF
ncbi:hypothetical protein [Alicyclobacillus kakegawensis]|uniref:hypothetical protein n=1 Tax=Alicyclobacillus kakegawensis TaxID=392012 RepID=UPI0008326801|nr:hypothetical protein [Alicyclobacillus kakegawensis]